MASGIEIKVILSNGDIKFHTLPFGLRMAEIIGWLDDNYNWKDYEIISGFN